MTIKKYEAIIELYEEKAIQLSSGALGVIQAYQQTKSNHTEEDHPIVIEDHLLWSKDFEDALNMLKVGNVEEVILADTSERMTQKALIHFLNNGWVASSAKIDDTHSSFGETRDTVLLKREPWDS